MNRDTSNARTGKLKPFLRTISNPTGIILSTESQELIPKLKGDNVDLV